MYVGFENSSTAINAAVIDEGGDLVETVRIDRLDFASRAGDVVDLLVEFVDPSAVEMVAYCFAWGDAQSAITDIEATTNKGNRGTPGFTPKQVDATIFEQLRDSELPCVTVPGVNDRLDSLHPYFRHYAQLSGPDKVADARNAARLCRAAGGDGETFVVANASSSTRALVVSDGRVRGAFHWLGLVHGWPDGDMYDAIMAGEVDPRRVVERSGLLYKPGKGSSQWPQRNDEEEFHRQVLADLRAAASEERLLELVYWATLHNVYSLVPFAAHDGDGDLERVVLSGRFARTESPYDVRGNLESALSAVAPTTVAEPFGTALGSALIARDVADGAQSVLGIPVADPPGR